MTGLIHRQTLRIQWGQCDPAGIVFYPQYLVMFDNAAGELFRLTGLSPAELRSKYGIVGLPLVEQSATFRAPCRFDDEIVLESTVAEWGRSSLTLRHCILKAGALCVEGFEKRVWAFVEDGKLKTRPIPPEFVASLSDASGATKIPR